MDHNISLTARVKKVHNRKTRLRSELLTVRARRLEIAEEKEKVRHDYEAAKRQSNVGDVLFTH